MKLPRRNLILWLLVAPLVSALINGALLYYMIQNFAFLLKEIPNSLNLIALIIIGVPIADGIIIFAYLAIKIYDQPESWDKKTEVEIETAVDDLQHAPKFFYILIFVILGITAFFFFNAVNEGFVNLPKSLDLSTPATVSLSGAVMTLVLAVIAMGIHLVRKDFDFYVAKMSVHIVGKTKNDENKRMHYLRIVLNSYDKFIEKNCESNLTLLKFCQWY